MESNDIVFNKQLLPCGKTIPNRLVKVAMYEHLASLLGGSPNPYHCALYSTWSEHDWGMIITGNVQVSRDHLTLGRDMVVPKVLTEEALAPFQQLSRTIHGDNMAKKSSRSLAVMQLNHAGRQSSNILGGRLPFASPLGPSALRFGSSTRKTHNVCSDLFHRLLFQTPRAMSSSDIETVVSDFVRGASLALHSGFDGIQLHVAHGAMQVLSSIAEKPSLTTHMTDLLAQFLSPKANTRIDEYSCDSLLLLRRIVKAIREVVPADFILGIKFNTGDYSVSDENETKEIRALAHLHEVSSWGSGVDFIEISGGDYENPEFMLGPSSVPLENPRQAFFAQFSSKLMEELSSMTSPNGNLPLVLLTGGLRTPAHLYTALSAKHTHLLGIGRSSVLCPDLPTVLKNRRKDQAGTEFYSNLTPFKPGPDLGLSFTTQQPWQWIWEHIPKVKLVGAGIEMAWYVVRMRRLAKKRLGISGGGQEMSEVNYIGGLRAMFEMWVWTDAPEIQAAHTILWTILAFVILCIGLVIGCIFVYD